MHCDLLQPFPERGTSYSPRFLPLCLRAEGTAAGEREQDGTRADADLRWGSGVGMDVGAGALSTSPSASLMAAGVGVSAGRSVVIPGSADDILILPSEFSALGWSETACPCGGASSTS